MKERRINPQVDKSILRAFVSKFLPSRIPLTEEQLEFIIDQLPEDELVAARNNSLWLQEVKERGKREKEMAQKKAAQTEADTRRWLVRTGKRRQAKLFGPIDEEVKSVLEQYRQRNERLFMILQGIIPGPGEEDTQPVFLKKGK